MKATILHENPGRIRVRMAQRRMSMQQADLLEAYLQLLPQVDRVTVHDRTCCAIIHYHGKREKLLEALSQFSYQDPKITALAPAQSGRVLQRTYQEKLVSRLLWKGISTLFFPRPLRLIWTVCHALPILWKGLRSIAAGKLKVELLDALSVGLSLAQGNIGTAGSVVFLLGLGELLEEWTHKKSVEDLARCMSLNVDRVWLQTTEGEVLAPLSQVQPGDLISVRMGNLVPLDGVVISGEGMVNQASLTGEAVPVVKRKDSLVYAGTVLEEGELTVQITQQSGQSRYDKIVTMIEQSQQMKSTAEQKASNLADKLVPYTLLGSGLCYLFTRNISRALSVLMVDFSCALKLAMPLAVLSAMGQAGRSHITVKGGKYLEAMAKADTIVFDKTGTLTHACPMVAKVIPFGSQDENEMLRLAACLEEHFPHSMANAVVRAAKDRGLSHQEMHTKVEYLVAHGIASTVNGQRVRIGSAHFVFEDEGCTVPKGEEETFANLPNQFSHLYLAIGQELAAVICIADPLRAEAKDALRALRDLGVQQLVMLTGDSRRTAAAIAQQVGVDQFQAEVLPEEKAQFVEQQRQAGHTVVMIGDGINDSPALSAADVGIAISDGAAIAREIADITVSANSLWELVTLRKLSMALMKRISSNYRFVIGFNGSLIALGMAGVLPPTTSATLHNLSTLGVSLRSMTKLSEPKRKHHLSFNAGPK